jgi:hypothetical protein
MLFLGQDYFRFGNHPDHHRGDDDRFVWVPLTQRRKKVP